MRVCSYCKEEISRIRVADDDSLDHCYSCQVTEGETEELEDEETVVTLREVKADTGVEINGPANIALIVDGILENHTVHRDIAIELQTIKDEALKTIEYIKHLRNPEGIAWHEIKGVKGE